MEIPDEKPPERKDGKQEGQEKEAKPDYVKGTKPDYVVLMNKLKGLAIVLKKWKFEKARLVGLKPFVAKDGMPEGWTLTLAFPKTMENETFESDANMKSEVASTVKVLTGAAFIGEGKEGG